MVLEVATLDVRAGAADEFEAAVRHAREIIHFDDPFPVVEHFASVVVA